jgi:C4-dicarboxylate-specific signal transduction histidine kinase
MAGTVIAGTLIIAAGYIGLFVAVGYLPATDAMHGIARYWVGDLSGVLTLTPLLLLAVNWREHLHVMQSHRWEVLAQLATVVLTLWSIFMLPVADQLRFFYLLFVPIIWIALRWSWPGAMLAVLAIQIGLLLAAQAGIPTARFIDLQFLMLTLSLTALLLGAVVAERAGVLERVAMREAEQRALLSMAPDAVLALDASSGIRVANAAAQRLFGERAVASQASSLNDLLPGLRLDASEGRAALEGRRGDGSGFPAEIAWARLDAPASHGFLVTVRDATERRLAEEQLRERDAALARAMRFAVAGELASALAHELNQPITALVSYLRASEILAERTAADDDRLRTTLAKAVQEAIRSSEVLRRLRDFYQGGALKHESLHIPSVCQTVVSSFQDRLRRADAALAVSVDGSIPAVQGDSTQLQIVLHNLLANALDAVMHVPPAKRRIELYATSAADTVIVRVEDSGPGVPADVAKELFEPFVTSKSDGMGLGLAISRSLVLARGGELAFAPSERLGGASFTVRLPIEMPPETPRV